MSTVGSPTHAATAATRPEAAASAALRGRADDLALPGAAPRLSELGKRIEMLRVERGVSKQILARAAGTSRQQLWRVMTGKSELTGTLCQRLASLLDVDSRTLSSAALAGAGHLSSAVKLASPRVDGDIVPARSVTAYLASGTSLMRTLRTLPAGEDGIALKCALLNCLEERARAASLPLPAWLFRVRASVLDGSL